MINDPHSIHMTRARSEYRQVFTVRPPAAGVGRPWSGDWVVIKRTVIAGASDGSRRGRTVARLTVVSRPRRDRNAELLENYGITSIIHIARSSSKDKMASPDLSAPAGAWHRPGSRGGGAAGLLAPPTFGPEGRRPSNFGLSMSFIFICLFLHVKLGCYRVRVGQVVGGACQGWSGCGWLPCSGWSGCGWLTCSGWSGCGRRSASCSGGCRWSVPGLVRLRVVTVFGLVRLRASVSQLLRWL